MYFEKKPVEVDWPRGIEHVRQQVNPLVQHVCEALWNSVQAQVNACGDVKKGEELLQEGLRDVDLLKRYNDEELLRQYHDWRVEQELPLIKSQLKELRKQHKKELTRLFLFGNIRKLKELMLSQYMVVNYLEENMRMRIQEEVYGPQPDWCAEDDDCWATYSGATYSGATYSGEPMTFTGTSGVKVSEVDVKVSEDCAALLKDCRKNWEDDDYDFQVFKNALVQEFEDLSSGFQMKPFGLDGVRCCVSPQLFYVVDGTKRDVWRVTGEVDVVHLNHSRSAKSLMDDITLSICL